LTPYEAEFRQTRTFSTTRMSRKFQMRLPCLHDPMELIQEAGNGNLHRVGTPSTLELVLVTLF
jgi:hypothetical protein